ncbi:hypothetical protein BpHYR1_029137 [Brachionus plicatilis]|uniref:Uncharacterized protein n=1 Tax=Brachionus plicatilis TaxID=10195 RepID=A0A3M7QSJ2_BRAPC|nr:hypothetical protein BpHYR1_029137 [Brachionus plicatilis]
MVESEANMICLQADLDAVAEWCWTWLMEANESKIKKSYSRHVFLIKTLHSADVRKNNSSDGNSTKKYFLMTGFRASLNKVKKNMQQNELATVTTLDDGKRVAS